MTDLNQLRDMMPFTAKLGIEIDSAEPELVTGPMIVVQTELRDDTGRLVAQVTQAQAVVAAAPPG